MLNYMGCDAGNVCTLSSDFDDAHVVAPYYNFGLAYPQATTIEAGDAACAGSSHIVLTVADYDALRSHMSGVTTSDVALLTTAVMLTWAVAWLVKRAVRVLIPNG